MRREERRKARLIREREHCGRDGNAGLVMAEAGRGANGQLAGSGAGTVDMVECRGERQKEGLNERYQGNQTAARGQ